MNAALLTPKQAGLTLDQLKALAQRGIVRLVWVNSRVVRVPAADIEALPDRLEAESRMAAGDDLAYDGLRKIYGYVPGEARA
jgi:hypothetical protein